ncbi:hypothetical protein RD110_23715 [Rhodoferax koreense]|uniref:Uncharacterized protein n=1 Tax=Rhodoferax koreensis TaxID=1842727 RepID=A0A1P8K1G6_9BURK|nr:hypothetical protein [Rhodoferax koreense]APW39837.1 hypothetical protein RD110_23715 [Rhodoferax koreense]
MKQIRLAWAQAITVVAGSAPVQGTDWEADTPEARHRLETQASAANTADGPDTYWVEDREA